jgi:hypothetical protein
MFASEVMPDGPANDTEMLIYNFAKFTLKLGCFDKTYYFTSYSDYAKALTTPGPTTPLALVPGTVDEMGAWAGPG